MVHPVLRPISEGLACGCSRKGRISPLKSPSGRGPYQSAHTGIRLRRWKTVGIGDVTDLTCVDPQPITIPALERARMQGSQQQRQNLVLRQIAESLIEGNHQGVGVPGAVAHDEIRLKRKPSVPVTARG